MSLYLALKGIPAFAASFAAIMSLWVEHRKWSRRYGIEDTTSMIITFFLIFTMFIYVYPLKMVFSALFSWISSGWLPTVYIIQNQNELINLFVIYGFGFGILMLILTFMYVRAIVIAEQLKLNKIERIKTEADISLSLVSSFTGFLSACFAMLMPASVGVFAGFVYLTLPITMPSVAIYYLKIEKKQKNE